ncbi:MAG: tetratricopeptide repeat protein, partial [Spirochaetota bacterium]
MKYAVPFALLLLLSCVSTAKRSLAERYYNIATDYYNAKNYKQAADYYELALKEDRNLKVVFFNYGLALIELKDYSQAKQQLMRAYAIDRRNTLCISALGYLSFNSKDYEEAANWYRQAVEINSFNPETFYNLGIVEQYLGNYEESQTFFDKIADLQSPQDQPTELRRFAALNQLYLGDEVKAMELYNEYFADRGANEIVFQDVYDFYNKSEEYDRLI